MRIIKNNGAVRNLTGKYIMRGYNPSGEEIYSKISLYSVITYLLMKIGILKWGSLK